MSEASTTARRPSGAASPAAWPWLLFVCLFLAAGPAAAYELVGRVSYVNDGDSFFLRAADGYEVEVRILGIDAPEREQPYSQVSRRGLQALILGRMVRALPTKHDRYGRSVAVVRVDGRDVALEQIAAGLAWFDVRRTYELDPRQAQRYLDAETQARQQRRGLWRQHDPLPPWEWRRRLRAR